MTDDALCVLLIGATGVFGRRLAEGIAREPDVNLILAGRTLRPLQALQRRLPRSTSICQLNRESVSEEVLRGTGADVVIDAAGPFQGSGSTVIEAAIDAGIHYIDLADGREFVANVRRYGAAAQRAGVAVISGASSTPALSHAVLDRMTRDWRRIDTVRVAISPGGRAPRGKSVARAILSWTGQQVRVFREGAWTQAPGWGPAREVEFPGVGKRLVSLCETPDLDLLAERYQPRVAAEFLAGVESRLLHHMLILAGLVVRRGWLRSLTAWAVPGRWLAGMVAPFGTDRGGMVVEASGRNSGDRPVLAR
jgi:saccharopine dehydrogenase-like NADP-dependent oxidoreductase